MTEIKVNNHTISITHPDKVLFPLIGITKEDLARYFLHVADHMLPFLKGRSITIRCFPEGLEKPGFFRQHAPEHLPPWFKTAALETKDGPLVNHMLCENKETLVYLANQNTIEIHRWLSRANNPHQPDIMLMDIDPPPHLFEWAVLAARLLKEKLAGKGYQADLMLTGSKGLHIISPCRYESFEQTKGILQELAKQMVEEHPDKLTADIRKDKRDDKVYLDISRNSYGQTAIAPFSPRAVANAPVAVPISWADLDSKDLKSDSYTIKTIGEFFKKL